MTETILSKEGYKKLQEELEHLKTVDRIRVIEQIKNARELGDLSENADYHDARERQSFIEGRIQEIDEKLKYAKIIEDGVSSSYISVGHKVTIICAGKEETYEIVGENESDPVIGKISAKSPVAEALLGKKIGDQIDIKIPAGKKQCKIIKIN